MTDHTTTDTPPPALHTDGAPSSSATIGELATALAKAQGAMSHAAKDSDNPHFGSRYADLAAIIDAARPAMAENGLSIVQRPLECADGIRLQTLLLHASGEWLADGVLFVPVSKRDAQGFGSALTYARRYALAALVGIAPDDDDGNAAVGRPAPAQAAAAPRQRKVSGGGRELTWPFGDMKGTPFAEMPSKDLRWMAEQYETKNDRFRAKDDAMRARARQLLAEREAAGPTAHESAPGPVTGATNVAAVNAELDSAAADAAARDTAHEATPPVGDAPMSPEWRDRLASALVAAGPQYAFDMQAGYDRVDAMAKQRGDAMTDAYCAEQVAKLAQLAAG